MSLVLCCQQAAIYLRVNSVEEISAHEVARMYKDMISCNVIENPYTKKQKVRRLKRA